MAIRNAKLFAPACGIRKWCDEPLARIAERMVRDDESTPDNEQKQTCEMSTQTMDHVDLACAAFWASPPMGCTIFSLDDNVEGEFEPIKPLVHDTVGTLDKYEVIPMVVNLKKAVRALLRKSFAPILEADEGSYRRAQLTKRIHSVTPKQLRRTLERQLGCDLSEWKNAIKETAIEYVEDMASTEGIFY